MSNQIIKGDTQDANTSSKTTPKNLYLEKRLPIFTYKKKQRRQSESNLFGDEYRVATLKRDSCLSLEPSEKTETDEENAHKHAQAHNRFTKFVKNSIENLFGLSDASDTSADTTKAGKYRRHIDDPNRRRVRSTSPYPNKSVEQQQQQHQLNQLYDIDSIKSSEESSHSVPSMAGSVLASSGISGVLVSPCQSHNMPKKSEEINKSKFFFPSMEPLQSQESVEIKSNTTNTANSNSEKTITKTSQTKPGTEILNLIATWIKHAPSDFLGK